MKKKKGRKKKKKKKHLQPRERGLSPLGAVGWAAAVPGQQPSLPGGHPAPPSPALLLPRGGEGEATAGRRPPSRGGGWCRGPPAPSTCSEGFIPFIYSSNEKWDVYTLGSWEPKQNIVFCTGGSYLWLVAKADNASSRDLPALCNKAIAHYRLIGISSGQLNQGQDAAGAPRRSPGPQAAGAGALPGQEGAALPSCPGWASARQGFQSAGARPKPLALIH